MAQEIFLSDENPVSGRWAILEDNGNSAWLYITKPGTQQPEKDAFVYSPVQPIERLNIEDIKEHGAPPILTKDLATDSSVLLNAKASEFRFRWSADGESVSVLYLGKPISMIVKESERGYSSALGKEGFFGLPWDQAVHDSHFK
jgi:hypothetical protein